MKGTERTGLRDEQLFRKPAHLIAMDIARTESGNFDLSECGLGGFDGSRKECVRVLVGYVPAA